MVEPLKDQSRVQGPDRFGLVQVIWVKFHFGGHGLAGMNCDSYEESRLA